MVICGMEEEVEVCVCVCVVCACVYVCERVCKHMDEGRESYV